jgi:membrane peptidoglycan carboxypeptidase
VSGLLLFAALLTGASAQQLFRGADATGAALALDVDTGAVVASVSAGRDLARPVLPLSVIKLYVAAIWWDHGLGGSLDDMLVDGLDQPGKDRAVALRQRIGGPAVLADLRRYGLESLTLAPDADDGTWSQTLSIGEQHVTVTLAQVARFLRTIALGRTESARRLQAAMIECVRRGTARSVAAKQAGASWQLGGKTGTGPATSKPYDGWFAGLVFAGGRPRYAVAVYVDGKGPGGGVAASIAAELARRLTQPYGEDR